MPKLVREEIIDRIRVRSTPLGSDADDRTHLFSAIVPERKIRHIVYIGIIGDGTSRTVDIQKIKEGAEAPYDADDVESTKFDDVPVPPAAQVPVPEEWEFDITNPFMTLEGGTTLVGLASAGAPTLTIIWWDSPEI